MKLSLLRFGVLCALALCTAMSTHAYAEAPGAPTDLSASVYWKQDAVVFLSWQKGIMGGVATSYQIYHATGLRDTYMGFEALGNPVEASIIDSSGLNQRVLGLSLNGMGIGDHSFYVTAINADGASEGSNIATLSIRQQRLLRITKYPHGNADVAAIAEVDKPFTYTVESVVTPEAEVRYSISGVQGTMGVPAGLSIDAETGVISWTPTTEGVYSFTIRAELADDATVFRTVVGTIVVSRCPQGVMISGVVKDEQGELITSGVVEAMMAFKRDTSNTGGDSVGIYVAVYRATIDRDGSYTLRVKPGTYKIFASGNDFASEYYSDASTIDDAQAVAVECGDAATVDMTVTRLQRYTVSGTVKRTGSGEGLAARITFVGYDNDAPAGTRRVEYFSTTSWNRNQTGEYSIALPGNYTYIAYAVVGDTVMNGNNGRIRNQTQYFDHKQDAAEATEINLTADRDGVNFDFGEVPSFDNGIVGRVIDTDGAVVDAYVVAYRMDNNRAFASALTVDGSGIYELRDIEPGEYIVAAYPRDKRTVLSGYYNEDGVAVPLWGDATRIVVGADSFITGIDIVLPKAVGLPRGSAVIRGKVSNRGGSIGKGDGTVLQADALAGALITLVDNKGVSLMYDLSGNSGDFSLAELPAGVYTLLIDKVGFVAYKGTITIANDTEVVPVDAALEPEIVTGVDEPITGNIVLRAFPNPTTNEVTVSFPAQAGTARITVVSSTGREVLSIRTATTTGTNQTVVDTKQLSSGAYFVHVVVGSEIYTLPLHIVR